MSGAPVLLYDGDCAFCAQSVQFLLRHDRRRRTARFAAREGPAGQGILARHPDAAAVDSLVWVETRDGAEQAVVRSQAVLAILGYLGGPWIALRALLWMVPRALRDAGYDFVARHRKALVAGNPACIVFSPEERLRVLDAL